MITISTTISKFHKYSFYKLNVLIYPKLNIGKFSVKSHQALYSFYTRKVSQGLKPSVLAFYGRKTAPVLTSDSQSKSVLVLAQSFVPPWRANWEFGLFISPCGTLETRKQLCWGPFYPAGQVVFTHSDQVDKHALAHLGETKS